MMSPFRSLVYCFLILLCLPIQSFAEVIQAKVVAITDGDTVKVLDGLNKQYKVRLMGIDAPEKNQPYGTRSKQSLSELTYLKQVTVVWNKTDRYQRVVGKILVGDKDINLEQIRRGMAWHYKKYQGEQTPEDRVKYQEAELEALRNRLGLWVETRALPPWEFRKATNSSR